MAAIKPTQKAMITRLSGRAILTEADQYECWDLLCDILGLERGSEAGQDDLDAAQADRFIAELRRMAGEPRCPGPCRERGARHTAIFRDDASLASDGLTSVPACALS